MNIWTLAPVDLQPMDELMIQENGLLRVVPMKELQKFPISTIQVWCVKRGVYQLPTEELIYFLREHLIKGRKTIEIGAGNGAIGRALGIPITDSYMQTRPEMVAYYRALGQEPILPPSDVQKFEALEAVKHFQPEIVLGCWITQLWQEGDTQGSVEGVDELAILAQAKYIHVGNDEPHGYKRSMKLKHNIFREPWLISRAKNPDKNHLCTWGL